MMMRLVLLPAIVAALAICTPSAALEPIAANDANTPEGRLAIEAYGACVVKLSPKESARVLSMDYKKSTYRTALKMLVKDAERPCARASFGTGRMRGDDLSMAAAIAEALIEADPTAVNARLAGIGAAQRTPLGKTDAVAHCLARSLPDQVSQLFATAPASEAEAAAAAPLLQAVPTCARATAAPEQYDLSIPAVRAILATASFRILAAQES
ncbi:hypothetical protein [Sphingopyxis sp.]|uniref:hypothetical protein n=1 Tax=Sphingopyxis sp. TaxID=1908224 RepID=UPI003D130979